APPRRAPAGPGRVGRVGAARPAVPRRFRGGSPGAGDPGGRTTTRAAPATRPTVESQAIPALYTFTGRGGRPLRCESAAARRTDAREFGYPIERIGPWCAEPQDGIRA